MNITEEGDLYILMKDKGSKLPTMLKELSKGGWRTHHHHDNWIHPLLEGSYTTHEAYKILKNGN